MALLLVACSTMVNARANDCSNADTQTALNICTGAAYQKSDAELNRVYQQVMLQLKGHQGRAKLLVRAQRNWLAFRDAECEFIDATSVGGSIHPLLVMQCRDKLTHQRISELKPLLHCQEGDMSCPVPAQAPEA